MGLVELLRHLARAAHDRDAGRVDTMLAALTRHEGWGDAIADFVGRMPESDAAYVSARMTAQSEEEEHFSGGSPPPRSFAGGSAADPMASVTRDATSSKYVPSTAGEWTSVMTAAGIGSGNPGWLWLLQEAAGALADTIGAAPLTNSGTMAYQSAVASWTRKAMAVGVDGGAYSLSNTTDTALPDLTAESSLIIIYASIASAPAADRGVILTGDIRAEVTATNMPKLTHGATSSTGTGNLTTAVRPWVLQYNRAASTTELFTDLEKLSIAFASGGSTKRIFFGNGFQLSPPWNILYAAHFKGAAAELTDAQIKTLLQTLGWSVSW